MSCTTVTKTMRKERFEVYVKGLTKDERKAFKTIKRHYNAIKPAQTRLKKMKIAAAKKKAIAERKAEREKAKLERELKKKCRPLLLELKKKLVPILKAKRQLKRLETAKAKKEAVAKRKAERELEKIRDFIVLHYKLTERDDFEWQCQSGAAEGDLEKDTG